MKSNVIELTPATIQIQRVTVDGKKMSLAMFRQIRPERIVVPDPSHLWRVAGKPLGYVNYFWGNDTGVAHLLWQKQGELRRWVARSFDSYRDLKWMEQEIRDWPEPVQRRFADYDTAKSAYNDLAAKVIDVPQLFIGV